MCLSDLVFAAGLPLAEPDQEGQWSGGHGPLGQNPGVSHRRKSQEALP